MDTEIFAGRLNVKLKQAIREQKDQQTLVVMMPEADSAMSTTFALEGKTVVLICGRDTEL